MRDGSVAEMATRRRGTDLSSWFKSRPGLQPEGKSRPVISRAAKNIHSRLADVDRKPGTVEKGIKKFQELPPSGEGTHITWTSTHS